MSASENGGQAHPSRGDPRKRQTLGNLLEPSFHLGLLPEPVEQHIRALVKLEHNGLPTGDPLRRLVAEELARIMEQRVRPRIREDRSRRRIIATAIVGEGLLRLLLSWIKDPRETLPERQDNVDTLERLEDPDVVAEWAPLEMVRKVTRFAASLYAPGEGSQANDTFYKLRRLGEAILVEEVEKETARLELEVGPGEQPWPSLPRPYVRPQRQEDLGTAVLQQQKRGGGWVAVVGGHGVGKSVLLAGLARDRRIRQVFGERVAFISCAGVRDGFVTGIGRYILAMAVTRQLGLPTSQEAWKRHRRKLLAETGSPGPMAALLDGEIVVVTRQGKPRQRTLSLVEWQDALEMHLDGRPALIIADDVADPRMLDWARRLPPRVVGVFATRDAGATPALRVPQQETVVVEGLGTDEAARLATQITGQEPEAGDREAMVACLEAVRGHPLLVRLVAGRARRSGWKDQLSALESSLTNPPTRGKRRTRDAESRRVRAVLEAVWEDLDETLQARLAALGQIPFFRWYDVELGRAVWGMTADQAQNTFNRLVQAGLLELHDDDGRYRLHLLVWRLARQKRKALSFVQRLRTRNWFRRYNLSRVEASWRWYNPSVQPPEDADLMLSAQDQLNLALFVVRSLCSSPLGTGWWWGQGTVPLDVHHWVAGRRRLVTLLITLPLLLGLLGGVLFLQYFARPVEHWVDRAFIWTALPLLCLLLYLSVVCLLDVYLLIKWLGLGASPQLKAGRR